MMAYVTIRALDHSSFICTFPESESINLFFPLKQESIYLYNVKLWFLEDLYVAQWVMKKYFIGYFWDSEKCQLQNQK